VLGLIFFHVAAFGCATFVHEDSDDFKAGYFKGSVGFDGDCQSYSTPSDLEGPIRFGRFIGVVGAFVVWVVFAVVAIASFFQFPRPELVFSVTAIVMVILSLLSLLLLSGKSALDGYRVGPGGILAIFAAFLWFGGAIAIVRFMKERPRTATTSTTSTKAPAIPGDPTSRMDDTEMESGIAATGTTAPRR
jgi:hypothetical protein